VFSDPFPVQFVAGDIAKITQDIYWNVQIESAFTALSGATITYAPPVYPAYVNNSFIQNAVPSGQNTGHQYRIRPSLPQLQGFYNYVTNATDQTIQTGSSWTVQLPANAVIQPQGTAGAYVSTVDDAYVGKFIWIKNAPTLMKTGINSVTGAFDDSYYKLFNDVRIISAYDGATRTCTVTQPFSANVGTYCDIALGNPLPPTYGTCNYLDWEILSYSADNFNPIYIPSITASNQSVTCYEVELLSLLLPNVILGTTTGNRIAFYNYLYVEVTAVNSTNSSIFKNLLCSNNPNSAKAVFRVPIDNISSPVSATFVSLSPRGIKHLMKFKTVDSFRFTVYLSTGELFKTSKLDNTSPAPADPNLQISAMLCIRRP